LKYWAFLSYSHTDKQWGDWLHKALETYRVPGRLIGRESRDGTVPPRVFPIFRDREELPVSADLGSNINEALRESRYLVVICSPRSAQSRWVGEEIKTYKKLAREDRILALIVEGEPNASDGKAGIPAEEECFPEALRYRMVDGEFSQLRSEPIAADAREGKDGRNNAKLNGGRIQFSRAVQFGWNAPGAELAGARLSRTRQLAHLHPSRSIAEAATRYSALRSAGREDCSRASVRQSSDDFKMNEFLQR
jgi:hypothetical protein